MLKLKIHRGTDMIGGSITEVYTENTHVFIDFGSELNPDPDSTSDKQMIEMIKSSECDAVLFSHYHGDHVGLLKDIPRTDVRGREIRLGMGLEARKVLIRIHKTLSKPAWDTTGDHKAMLELLKDRSRWEDFSNGKTFKIGDITITTVRVDHSAYDAYMFIIQAGGKTVVHTGDYRTHGRLGVNLFPDLTENLERVMEGKKPDVLITEGTMLERTGEKVMTEEDLEKKATELLRKPENKWAFLVCSSTNVESLASFHNAAMNNGRPFIVSHYVHEQLMGYRRSTENKKMKFWKAYHFEPMDKPMPELGGLTQPEYMMENGFLMMVGTRDSYIPRMDYFRDKDPLLIYSMWDGYINREKYPDTYNEDYGRLYDSWRHTKLHTSGHATVEDIEKMIATVDADVIIPIHTTKKKGFEELRTGRSEIKVLNDGDIYEL